MDLAAIGAFVAVGDSGGFRSAALILGMTSSGVSKAVTRLENKLGVQLLARTTRSVRMTPAGLAFHVRCKAILADLAAAEHQASEASVIPKGSLTVTMSSTGFGRNRVVPVISDYVRLYPQVSVQARLSDRLVDLVEEGVDLAIRIGHLPDSGLVATRVGETGYVLCASPEYLATHGIPAHPDELDRHCFIGFVTPGTATRFEYRFLVDGRPTVRSFPAQLTVDDGDALVQAALRSIGLIMIVDYLVEDALQAGHLVRVLRDFEVPPVPVSVVHVPSRHPSPAARALIGMLKTALRTSRAIPLISP